MQRDAGAEHQAAADRLSRAQRQAVGLGKHLDGAWRPCERAELILEDQSGAAVRIQRSRSQRRKKANRRAELARTAPIRVVRVSRKARADSLSKMGRRAELTPIESRSSKRRRLVSRMPTNQSIKEGDQEGRCQSQSQSQRPRRWLLRRRARQMTRESD